MADLTTTRPLAPFGTELDRHRAGTDAETATRFASGRLG